MVDINLPNAVYKNNGYIRVDTSQMTEDEFSKLIYNLVVDKYGDAVVVKMFINSEGIEIAPKYRNMIEGFSMKKINDSWCKKR